MVRCLTSAAFVLFALLPGCDEPADVKERPADGGSPVRVEASVDEATVPLGRTVTYTVRVLYADGFEVDFPPILEQFENWEIEDPGIWRDADDVGTRRVREISIVLDPGVGPVLEIPATTIRYRPRGEDPWETVSTEAITVTVSGETTDEGEFLEPLELYDMPSLPAEPKRLNPWIVGGIVGGGLLVCAALALLLLRNRRRRAPPVLAPHEFAQRGLARLDAMDLLERGVIKEYYSRLTDIVRRYIELRFGLMAPERTTEEFLAEAQASPEITDDGRALLTDLLRTSDLVKFARHEPPRPQVEEARRTAEHFVMSTLQLAVLEEGE